MFFFVYLCVCVKSVTSIYKKVFSGFLKIEACFGVEFCSSVCELDLEALIYLFSFSWFDNFSSLPNF